MENNLFYYATSELSQDAAICYLLSFAMPEYESKDMALSACVRELLGKMLQTDKYANLKVTGIKRQYKHIDILAIVNWTTYIIIEDKTFTGQHGNQLNRYKEQLLEEGIAEHNIHCVYYKIVEQAHKEPNAVNITRGDVIRIFGKCKSENRILAEYLAYLRFINADVNAFTSVPIEEWRKRNNHTYKGFFAHLVDEQIIDTSREYSWGYVSNRRGGFWGLWWYSLSDAELAKMGLTEQYINGLYLQIEDNTIAVKLHAEVPSDIEVTKRIRKEIGTFFAGKIPSFEKSALRNGRYTTVGRVFYTMDDYTQKLKAMEETMILLCTQNFSAIT